MPLARPTIFALSSGRPPCAIAVIRISGPDARVALETMTGRLPPPRVATFARVRDPQSDEVIDEGLALWFPGPKSETGEDIAELQIHGGRAVVAAVLGAVSKLEGFRHAEAGEFTRRAFENGRLDLTAVEGLADLVAAETQAQRKQALRQMQGEFARVVESWRTRLIEARALLEAGIDFADEGDVPAGLAAQALGILRPLLGELAQARRGQGERLRDGLQIAIAGPPNVGKSTLLNRIAQRDVAIVSPHAGTTRDVLEVHLDLGGYPVTLRDTAGIRPTDDPVEQEGVRRARQSATAADLVLWVVDASVPDASAVGEAIAQANAGEARLWVVVNKIDLLPAETVSGWREGGDGSAFTAGRPRESGDPGLERPPEEALGRVVPTAGHPRESGDPGLTEREIALDSRFRGNDRREIASDTERSESKFDDVSHSHFAISAATGEGIESFLAEIAKFAESFFSAEPMLVTRQRHQQMIAEAAAALKGALALADREGAESREELVAEQVRIATRALERLTGRVDVEDILDVIFRDFCIGK